MSLWRAALQSLWLCQAATQDTSSSADVRPHVIRRDVSGVDPKGLARVEVTPAGFVARQKWSLDIPAAALDQDWEEEGGGRADTTTTTTLSGPVVENPAMSESERIQLEEETEECMIDTPMYVCWQKFGSYGIRRLYTEQWDDIVKMGYERPTWMAHEKVQRRQLFDLTLPGTHNSGTYDFTGSHQILGTGLAFGVQNQHLDIVQQLETGIRAFDLRVSLNEQEGRLYASHMVLTVPLSDILGQMRAWLEKRKKEVIIISAKVGRMSHHLSSGHRDAIIAEDSDPTKVPGQMVHHLFLYHFGRMLATYATLSTLPAGESMENPRVSSLVGINARVLYFWEGQQVLCTDGAMCQRTPGWTQPWSGLAFGWPMPLGVRKERVRQPLVPVMEPGCLSSSWESTASAHPDSVARKVRSWLFSIGTGSQEFVPSCFPHNAPLPLPHRPTLLHWADGSVTLSEHENNIQRSILSQAKALFTRGEGFGLMSSAERMNYLMLVWLMKNGSRPLWTRANVVAQDFVSPILVHRIIEAMQEQQDCGWAMTCKATGSCWAGSLLGEDGNCRSEEAVTAELEAHAGSKELSMWLKVLIVVLDVVLLIACVGVCICACCRKKQPPPEKGAADAANPDAANPAGPRDAAKGSQPPGKPVEEEPPSF